MKKKNRITTNSLRTIKISIPRFISLMIMSMLGVFVFSGLQATSPDMINTLDKYFDQNNVYDLKILSTMGLVEDDINALKNVEGINEVERSYSKDVLIQNNQEEYVVNISSIPKNLNKIQLIEGTLPKKNDDIVVEASMLEKNNLNIGDKVKISDDSFKVNEFTITGVVKSPLYFNSSTLNNNRGATSIGSGTINYYAYVKSDSFDLDYYTYIYITINEAKEKVTSSESYIDLISNIKDSIDPIKESQEKLRYESIYSELVKNIGISSIGTYNSENILNSIKYPTWYIYDRQDNSTYSGYIEDSNSIKNLSKIFPIVFFAVAILISLISMNRMVEDDRLEIGTLKSLGFSNKSIMHKYLLFSLLATVAGGILGSVLGIVIIPTIIFNIYGILFDLPRIDLSLNLLTTLIGFLISIICICGTTIITVIKVLKEKPAALMRAKPPKNGKRVFLENIKVIWKSLKFSNKITIRNLFRYKKRLIVTVCGIAGCTALMLCGFGIKDSIVDITKVQYGEVFKFDAMVYLDNLDINSINEVFNYEEIYSKTPVEILGATLEDIEVNMFICDDNEKLSKVVNLSNRNTNKLTKLENGKVIITDKLADLLSIKIGDDILVHDVNNNSYTYEVSDIVKNYIGHYIYIDKSTYESSGMNYKPNVIYFNTIDLTSEEQDNLTSKLIENDSVISVSFISSQMESVSNMLESLDKVVAILIVLAAMLAFVVLYNLSNININERKREIATLKVLGFYDHEVDNYITKETIISTILGIIIGLVFGYFLTNVVITSVELEKTRFIHHISLQSYLYASAMSALFTLIVNFITHFSLKKIDMIESLKSVE